MKQLTTLKTIIGIDAMRDWGKTEADGLANDKGIFIHTMFPVFSFTPPDGDSDEWTWQFLVVFRKEDDDLGKSDTPAASNEPST